MKTELTLRRIIAFFARLLFKGGKCEQCGMPYQLTKKHITWLDSIGISALCEDCFQHLSPTKRIPFYQKMKVWQGSGSADEVNWPLTKKAILAES